MSKQQPATNESRGAPSDEDLRSALPQKKRRLELRVGAFVLLGLASSLVALFLLTDPSTFRGRFRVSTVVEDAGGIRRGDPVQMRGVNIGRVMAFSMDTDGVRITLEIEGAWDIPADSRCRLVSGGILGGRTVEIEEGSSPELARGGDELPGENVEGIFDMPAELGQNADRVLTSMQDLLAQPTIAAVQGSVQELQGLLVRLSVLAEEQGKEVARLTASLNRSAAGLEDAAGSGEDVARAVARADSTLITVHTTTRAVLQASQTLQMILQRVEAGEGTLGQLSANPALYEELTGTLESIRLLANDLRENPGRYVKIEIF